MTSAVHKRRCHGSLDAKHLRMHTRHKTRSSRCQGRCPEGPSRLVTLMVPIHRTRRALLMVLRLTAWTRSAGAFSKWNIEEAGLLAAVMVRRTVSYAGALPTSMACVDQVMHGSVVTAIPCFL